MGDYTQADMTGVLFKNERKQPGDDFPDYQGSATVKGIKYGIGGWIKKSKTGKTYMSLSVRPWQQKQIDPSKEGAQAARNRNTSADFQDDPEIPF